MAQPLNILICFSKPRTGEALSLLSTELIRGKADNSSVAVLHLLRQEQRESIENLDAYKNQLFSDIINRCEKNNIIIRTFVKESDAFASDILETAKEQNSNLILLGVGGNVFNSTTWEKYRLLKSDPINSEEFIYHQFDSSIAQSLKSVSSLLNRSMGDTGIFIDNSFEKADNLFVPILCKNDLYTLPFLNRFAMRENTSAMVWDAIGILSSTQAPDIQKSFLSLQKKADGRIKLWNNNKKIENTFIQSQDLVLAGMDGWNKLIATPLAWRNVLPSMLIIKKGQSET